MTRRFTKSTLPEKFCASCGRPFSWRKKWVRDWDEVKTCSERCKRQLRADNRAARSLPSLDLDQGKKRAKT